MIEERFQSMYALKVKHGANGAAKRGERERRGEESWVSYIDGGGQLAP